MLQNLNINPANARYVGGTIQGTGGGASTATIDVDPSEFQFDPVMFAPTGTPLQIDMTLDAPGISAGTFDASSGEMTLAGGLYTVTTTINPGQGPPNEFTCTSNANPLDLSTESPQGTAPAPGTRFSHLGRSGALSVSWSSLDTDGSPNCGTLDAAGYSPIGGMWLSRGVDLPDLPDKTLDVSTTGTGTGTITGPGINCPGDCTETYDDGEVVNLSASPSGGSTFTGWTGDCSGSGPCQVTMSANRNVQAGFDSNSVSPATINGVVSAPGGGGPLPNATVWVCSNTCASDTTDGLGAYTAQVPAGPTFVQASAPPSGPQYTSASLPSFNTTSGQTVNGKDITLGPAPTPIPPGTGIGGGSGSVGGVPIVRPVPFELTHQAEEGCTVSFEITKNGNVVESGPMQHTPPPSGRFLAMVDALPPGGTANVSISVTGCPTPGENEEIDFTIYIDPSGFIRNGNTGQVIVGATVVLLRSDSPFGPFTQVPNGSVIMSPSNRTNPDTTDATGHFGWDVVAGYYKVRASAPGCTTGETVVYEIPPPVTDIDLALSCPTGGGGGAAAAAVIPQEDPPTKCKKGQKLKKGKCVKKKKKKKK